MKIKRPASTLVKRVDRIVGRSSSGHSRLACRRPIQTAVNPSLTALHFLETLFPWGVSPMNQSSLWRNCRSYFLLISLCGYSLPSPRPRSERADRKRPQGNACGIRCACAVTDEGTSCARSCRRRHRQRESRSGTRVWCPNRRRRCSGRCRHFVQHGVNNKVVHDHSNGGN